MKQKKQHNIISTEIDGLNIEISINNIHIQDGYKIFSPIDMKNVLKDIETFLFRNNIKMDTPFNHRSINSMMREWLTINNLYNLNFRPERTKDVDIDYPQRWYEPLLYFLGSIMVF